MTLSELIFLAGLGQLSVLVAASAVPIVLDWRNELRVLPHLHRQMYWVYGGYVAMSIVAFGALSIVNARDLADGTPLARGMCTFIAVFWGVRLTLQAVFDTGPYLSRWWIRGGNTLLTILFAAFTLIYGWGAMHSIAR
jgi:hypothetical protein